MNKGDILRNADFLSIAMEQMNEDDTAYEFVEDVHDNLMEDAYND